MALADLRDELNCSICRELYIDPVMLPCGHNYCQGCIIKTWESEESREEVFSCPDCRRSFMRRPEITRNLTLRNIVDKVRLNQKESGIFCTYCVHSSVHASKTCLLCEASLCVTHLYWHSKSEKHVLTEPTAVFESKKCSIHGKVLYYYCKVDGACICESCYLDGEHRGHQVEKLKEASEKRKESLRKVLEKLCPKKKHIEEREQRLEGYKRQVKCKSEDQTKEVSLLFTDIRKHHEALEKRVNHEISQLEANLSHPFTDQIRHLEIKKQNLIKRIHQIEELCNMVNPIAVIEEWNSQGAALSYTEEGDNEGSRREELLAPDLEQMDQVSETLLTGLNGIVNEISTFIYKQKAPIADIKKAGDVTQSEGRKTPCCSGKAQQEVSSCTKESKKQTLFRSVSCFEASCCVVPPMYMKRATDLTLDINTAANNIVVSDDKKTVSYSESSQGYTDSSDRFQQSQVLSSRSFASGQHYWEVEISELGEVRIGVAYPSIARKGFQSYIGENPKSWCLYRYETSNKLEEKQQKFSGRHGSKETNLPYKVSCHRLGVYLDCEAGSVSFYELCDQIRHLHTFTATFTEPLHAAFCVWGDASVTILS
ncbi:E3 ubiquitin/ISG15 ligase TRIM25 [Xenopus laevis]|uniref:Uncharacterized protein n=2 Tax=Xenopus laevis TaxID=8355 RepID=A0A974BZ37_XENLA|nr:E3 ubiquitin/ISG15 ligase TRIM25 [Xenopus laevis]OCT63120.1 hypothetical protein XELAEV_18044216mg [Xenopus laevis]